MADKTGGFAWRGRDGATFAVGLAAAAFVIAICLEWEGHGATLTFTLATSGAIVAAIAAISRRIGFAAATTAALVMGVELVSWRKYAAYDMIFHAWDIVEFVTSPEMARGLWARHREELLAGLAITLAFATLLGALFRAERARGSRLASVAALVALGVVAGLAAQARPQRAHLQYFWEDQHLASFYASFAETADTMARGGLVVAAPEGVPAPFERATACAPAARPPHVILIHEESIVQPDLIPDLDFDHALLPFFRSDDGREHRLRVETYGGASWLTEFSVFSGVSTRAFGSMRNFVTVFAAGKLGDALPRVLANCGYKTIMFTPWDSLFMAAGRFYQSIGFSEIDDRRVQGNKLDNERDRFFFGNMLARIEKGLAQSPQPLFLFVETMSAHWPYDYAYMPDVDVPGGGEGTPPQMSEYLRRLAMVKMDDDWLRAELARRFPGERFLIVRYGDHHPSATLPYYGLPENLPAEEVNFAPDSTAFTTFFAINGVGYAPPPPPDFDTLEIPWLGVVLLDAAGLPAPPDWRERQRLMRACAGLFWTCADRAAILGFDRRLLDSGLLPTK